jgi:hypothetical protein
MREREIFLKERELFMRERESFLAEKQRFHLEKERLLRHQSEETTVKSRVAHAHGEVCMPPQLLL